MSDDLLDKLRAAADNKVWWSDLWVTAHKAAAEILRLRAENEKLRAELQKEFNAMRAFEMRSGLEKKIEKLRAALKPFADEASVGPMPGEPDDPRRCNMKFLRAAAAALKETGE